MTNRYISSDHFGVEPLTDEEYIQTLRGYLLKNVEEHPELIVMVVSDEIWSDLTLEGYKHIPTQSVSEDAKNRTVALYAPAKTFNLAGLVGGYHIIYNKHIREQVMKERSGAMSFAMY